MYYNLLFDYLENPSSATIDQMVYHKVYDALEKYGVEKNVIRESGE